MLYLSILPTHDRYLQFQRYSANGMKNAYFNNIILIIVCLILQGPKHSIIKPT